MICPHCGRFIENSLWGALQPYRRLNLPVVVTNVDAILEVGPRIRAIFEEKNGKTLSIRGFQAVTLKKIAKRLDVPLFYIHRNGELVKLYQYDTSQIVESTGFIRADQLVPVFSGTVEELGRWIFDNLISPALSDNKRKRR